MNSSGSTLVPPCSYRDMHIASFRTQICFLLSEIPSAEAIEQQVIEELRNPLGTFSFSRYLPRDPVRLFAAQHLAACAYLILFAHELAHLELCHLSFLRDELGLEEHQEVTAIPLSDNEALLFRTLEWDADNSALATSLKVWRLSFPSELDFS